MSDDGLSHEDADALNAVLSFYGSELTSHAGIAMASVIAFLTLIEVRLILPKDSSPYAVPILLVIMTIVIFVGLYAVLRIAVYGALSSTVLSFTFTKDFNDFWNLRKESRRFPTARINEYAVREFARRFGRTRKFYSLKSAGVWLLFMPLSAVASALLLYVVV